MHRRCSARFRHARDGRIGTHGEAGRFLAAVFGCMRIPAMQCGSDLGIHQESTRRRRHANCPSGSGAAASAENFGAATARMPGAPCQAPGLLDAVAWRRASGPGGAPADGVCAAQAFAAVLPVATQAARRPGAYRGAHGDGLHTRDPERAGPVRGRSTAAWTSCASSSRCDLPDPGSDPAGCPPTPPAPRSPAAARRSRHEALRSPWSCSCQVQYPPRGAQASAGRHSG